MDENGIYDLYRAKARDMDYAYLCAMRDKLSGEYLTEILRTGDYEGARALALAHMKRAFVDELIYRNKIGVRI